MNTYTLTLTETHVYKVVVQAQSISKAVDGVLSEKIAPELIEDHLSTSTEVVAAELSKSSWSKKER